MLARGGLRPFSFETSENLGEWTVRDPARGLGWIVIVIDAYLEDFNERLDSVKFDLKGD